MDFKDYYSLLGISKNAQRMRSRKHTANWQ